MKEGNLVIEVMNSSLEAGVLKNFYFQLKIIQMCWKVIWYREILLGFLV